MMPLDRAVRIGSRVVKWKHRAQTRIRKRKNEMAVLTVLALVFLLALTSVRGVSAADPVCSPGKFLRDSTCKDCPAGWRQAKKGRSACTACFKGKYQ